MIGAGFSPAGVSPAGSGVPTSAPANGGAILSDAQGNTHGARYINPTTRRHELDAFGRYKGMPALSHLVEHAFLTERGTSALPNLGLARVSGTIGANFARKREQDIRDALAFLTVPGFIEIVSIDVDTSRRPVTSVVRWRDLSTFDVRDTQVQ